MFNLQPFDGKIVQSIDHRHGGDQIIIHFTDGSFLIITGQTNELECSGRALDNEE